MPRAICRTAPRLLQLPAQAHRWGLVSQELLTKKIFPRFEKMCQDQVRRRRRARPPPARS